MTLSKTALRKKGREICSKIPLAQRQQAARAAATLFVNQPLFKRADHIACYLSCKDEFDSSPLIEAIWQAKKKCYVPVLNTEKEKSLYFVRYQYGDALHVNRYSILEPVNTTRKIAPEELELVITPLLAFDIHGHRLGTGGGYYDTTFAFLPTSTGRKPHMIGLAYAAQQMELLPHDPWDILLNGVVTEKKYFAINTTTAIPARE